MQIGETEILVVDTERVWFSVPDARRRLVPARGIFLIPQQEEQICAEIEKGNRTVEIVIDGEDVQPALTTFELSQVYIKDVLAACARS